LIRIQIFAEITVKIGFEFLAVVKTFWNDETCTCIYRLHMVIKHYTIGVHDAGVIMYCDQSNVKR
jgi:hypothetical protein